MPERQSSPRTTTILSLVVASTVLGIAGIDLILPAIPTLPAVLGGNATHAQYILATYVAGTAVGLIGYGVLADRFATRTLFIASLLATAVVSAVCASVDRIGDLAVVRALQGMVAAGPAVFAPGLVKAMLDESRAVRAIGVLGSVESLVPAIAPIVGAWLLALGSWRLSFFVIAVLALVLALTISLVRDFPQTARRAQGSYRSLLCDPVFIRYALSQALALGGLLSFVFAMPAVFVRALGGSLTDFVVMQVCGVSTFIIAANASAGAVTRFGSERVIRTGTQLSALGALGIVGYALTGGEKARIIAALFVLVNVGFGLRAPPGFYRAVLASHNDDARGSALVILGVFGAAAAGTAIAAPFVEHTLVVPALVALVLHLVANGCLILLPKGDHP